VFERRPPREFTKALLGRRVRGLGRHGKHLWLELDRRPWPCFHFGMTGEFHAPSARAVRLVSSGSKDRGIVWPPRFAKLRLTFDDGGELVMTDPRRLGRIRLRKDPASESPISSLGFDALLGLPRPAEFAGIVRIARCFRAALRTLSAAAPRMGPGFLLDARESGARDVKDRA